MVLCNLCLVRAFIRVLVPIATCAALLPAGYLPLPTADGLQRDVVVLLTDSEPNSLAPPGGGAMP